MDKQLLQSQGQKIKPICTHIKKLSKKQVTQIIQNPAEVKCQTHHLKVRDQSLCLHCNKIFCGLNSVEKCISTHQKVSQGHIFSVNLRNGAIFCSECNQTIEFLSQVHSSEVQNQDLKKLRRFIEFIHETLKKLKALQQEMKQCQEEMHYRGLQNLGNTCFLNTDLQVLNYSQALVELYQEYKFNGSFSKSISSVRTSLSKQVEYFYDDVIQQGESKIWHVVTKKKDIHAHESNQKLIKTITNCKFNQLVKNLFKQMRGDDQKQPFEPVTILDFLAHVDRKYSSEEEQDAQETLLFMIDILVQGQLTTMNYDMDRYHKVERLIGRQKISPTQRVFGFYLVSQVFCQNCKKTNFTLDLTYHLSIDAQNKFDKLHNTIQHHLSKQIQMKQKVYHKSLKYPRNESDTLVLPEFMQSFFQEQRLTQRQNYYSCSNCKSLVGLKKFYLVDLPQILIISIKRFNHKMVKNSRHVSFEEIVDLKDVVLVTLNQDGQEQTVNSKYRLYAVIVHLGDTIHNGHYVCFVRASNNIWLRCSDHAVKKVTWREVKEQQAYVLLYQKVIEEK